jgi:hypothetical protein
VAGRSDPPPSAGSNDVLYPGHKDVPVGTPDLDWMPVVAQRQPIVVTRDRRVRARPAELRAYWENGVRSVWIGAKHDLGRPGMSPDRDSVCCVLFLEV